MDPISGIASFVSIADALFRLWKRLRRYTKNLTVAAAEARRLADEIFDFHGLLGIVDEVLSGIRGIMQQSSEFMRVEQAQIDSAKDLIDRLKSLTKGFPILLESGQDNFFQKWLMRHRWTEIKEDIQVLQFSIQSSKGSLNILLNVVQLASWKDEQVRLLSAGAAAAEENSRLKEKIARCEKRIRAEKKQTERVRADFSKYVSQHAKRLEISSAMARATKVAVKLAEDRIQSMLASSSSGSIPRRSHSRRSSRPSPSHPEQLTVPVTEETHPDGDVHRVSLVVEEQSRPSSPSGEDPGTHSLTLRSGLPHPAEVQRAATPETPSLYSETSNPSVYQLVVRSPPSTPEPDGPKTQGRAAFGVVKETERKVPNLKSESEHDRKEARRKYRYVRDESGNKQYPLKKLSWDWGGGYSSGSE